MQTYRLERTFKNGSYSDRDITGSSNEYLKAQVKLALHGVLDEKPKSFNLSTSMAILKAFMANIGDITDFPERDETCRWTDDWNYLTRYCGVSIYAPPKPSPDMLVLDEYNLTRFGISGKPRAPYFLKVGMQEAYLDALDKVPQMNENSLSNVLELVGFLKALLIDHRIEIPKSLGSAWLSYRYTYTTTKLDAEEAIAFVHRNMPEDLLQNGFSCYGHTTVHHSGMDIVVKCHLSMRQKELTMLDKIWSSLYRYGLSPSFYMIWDMIPYSFIVDWFIPVGDILSGYDKTLMYDRTYDISDIWFSTKYLLTDNGFEYQAYTRWASSSPPEFNGYYTLENKGTTANKVLGYRVLDTLSLMFC
jgi:hypothetical protein